VLVDAAAKQSALEDADMKAAISDINAQLGAKGRVLVRASGTEPLIRIMLEGENEDGIRRLAVSLAKILESKYNGRIRQ